jgi:hypothetical protein
MPVNGGYFYGTLSWLGGKDLGFLGLLAGGHLPPDLGDVAARLFGLGGHGLGVSRCGPQQSLNHLRRLAKH